MVERKEASYFSLATALSLMIAAVSGGIWVGAIASDVEHLQKDESKVEEIAKEVKANSVKLAAVAATQQAVLKAQEKQDKKLDKILDKLDEE